MNLFFAKILTLTFFWASFAQAATHIVINSPQDGWDLRKQTVMNLSFTVHSIDAGINPKIVVFRNNNGWWPRVQEIAMNRGIATHIQNAIPAKYYCEDLYAIRIMDGDRTLAGPVHFNAGVGACSHTDKNKFVNLEANQFDLETFRPANQGDRDTCSSFAAAAALSAAYYRLKGVKVLLSQNFLHHLVKSGSYNDTPYYLYENQSSIWGGNNITDAFKIIKNYGAPSEVYAPYQFGNQLNDIRLRLGIGEMNWSQNPQLNRISQMSVDTFEYSEEHIPLLSRLMAHYRAKEAWFWRGALAKDTLKIESALRSGIEVVIGLSLQWKEVPQKAKTFNFDPTSRGGHMMLIVGYDKTDAANPYFLVKNSYGDGIVRMHYDVLLKNENPEIGYIQSVHDVGNNHPTRWFGQWNMKHDRWIGKLFIRRAYEMAQDRYSGYLRIGEYQHQNGQRYCAYGQWDATSKKLMMKINFDKPILNSWYDVKWDNAQPTVRVLAKDVCSPVASGQYFELNMSSNLHNSAWGHTIWNGISFNAEISR